MFPRIPPAAVKVATYLAERPSLVVETTDPDLAAELELTERTVRSSVAELRAVGAIDAPPRLPGRVKGQASSVRPRVITRRPSHWLWEALGLDRCDGLCGFVRAHCICDAFDNDAVPTPTRPSFDAEGEVAV